MMKRLTPASSEFWASTCILVVLLAMTLVPTSAYRFHPRDDTSAKKLFRTLQKKGLNKAAAAQQTAGYYEGLLDGAVGIAGVGGGGGRGWFDWRFWFAERATLQVAETAVKRDLPGYLRYDLPPNINVPDLDERRRIVTNSMGMADKEYPVESPVKTWRIGLIGDSVSQGIGTEFGNTFEARLEDHLNKEYAGRGYERYEILNFSVRGYQITHFVEVGLHRVPPFSPDAYVVALTVRSVYRSWADHLASLVRNRVDLKYDFLREIVRESGVGPNMTEALINARLAPYRIRVLHWALAELQAQARRDGVPLVVLLVPIADDTELQLEEFSGVKPVLADLSIPTIDLLETFAYLDDLAPVRVSDGNRHPNDNGHKMLFDAILSKLRQDERLMAAFTGAPPRAAPPPPQSATGQ